MISRIHLYVILLIASITWGIILIIGGVAVSVSWLRPLSMVTGILLILLFIFDRWLWRWKPLQGWFVKRPNIHGTWRGTIKSTWVDPKTGSVIEPIEGFMVIRQTFSSLSLRLITSESASELIGAEITYSPDKIFQIAGVYRNEPKLSVRNRSQMHYGAILLQVIGKPITTLKGSYWTDRDTKGELNLTDHSKEIFHDFESARRAFNNLA